MAFITLADGRGSLVITGKRIFDEHPAVTNWVMMITVVISFLMQMIPRYLGSQDKEVLVDYLLIDAKASIRVVIEGGEPFGHTISIDSMPFSTPQLIALPVTS